MPFEVVWTNEQVELTRKLAADGYSARMIAEELNRKFKGASFTRLAVIGKCHRIQPPIPLDGYAKTTEEARRQAAIRSEQRRIEFRKKIEQQRANLDTSNFTGEVGELPEPGCCCYVVGDIHTLKACGKPAERNAKGRKTNYCASHQAVVYAKSQNTDARKRDRAAAAAGSSAHPHRHCKTAINTAFI